MVTVHRRIFRVIDLLDFYLQRKIFRQKIPLLASFKLTYRCNLTCPGCPFYLRAHEPDSHMSWNKAVSVLSALKGYGARIVIFEGGEPLLWRDGNHGIGELILYAKTLFSTVGVTTNGTFALDVPADVLWVSIDGLKATHDRLRNDSFDGVLRNLKATTHPRVFVHFTMNRENWGELEQLLELLKELPVVKGLTLQIFYSYNQGEAPLALLPAERRIALEAAIRLKAKYRILNSQNRLRAIIDNNWHCHDDILINVDPDGTITRGCYAKNRGRINCRDCGFTPVAEASGALDLNVGSLIAGLRTFL
jgi:MoaA/NifB/PqqE/SkfB family radical SAM enzyme